MGSDAVKDLREWQRREASVQEKALRAAAKAQERLIQLDEQRAGAEAALADALAELATAGIAREQAAAFLGVALSSFPNRSATGKRRPAADAAARISAQRERRPTGGAVAQSVQS